MPTKSPAKSLVKSPVRATADKHINSVKNKVTSRAARLEFRLTAESRARIEKAAILKGQTLSDFASSVLLQEADEVLDQFSQRALTESEWGKFLTLLRRPAKPNHALKNAATRYKKGHVAGEQYQFSLGEK